MNERITLLVQVNVLHPHSPPPVPNPPGLIEVLTKTTSSIEIRWREAPLMTGVSFDYKLTNTPSQGGGYIITKNTSHTFDSLLSGTSYNISIATVGALCFESEKVHIDMVTTRKVFISASKQCASTSTLLFQLYYLD